MKSSTTRSIVKLLQRRQNAPQWGLAAAIASMVLLGTPSASAQAGNDAWSTTPADANFSGTNWTTGTTTPGVATGTAATGDSLYFGTSSITALNNDDTGFSFGGLTFNSGASAFTLGGNAFTLTGGITNNSTSAQAINTNITLGAPETVNANTGAITLGGNIGDGGSGFGLTKTGTGTLTLSGANTYTGTTTVNGGTLALSGSLISNALSLGGSTFNYSGAGTQSFATTTINGGGQSAINNLSTGMLALGTLTQTASGSLNFGTIGTTTTTTANTNGILGGWTTTGNAGTTAATGDFVANDGSGNIVAYTGYTAVSGVTTAVGTQNWNNSAQSATTQVNTTGAINSLKQGADFSVGNGATLTVNSGGIIMSGISRWLLNNNNGSTAGSGKITSGLTSGELFVDVADAQYNKNGDGNNWRIWTNIVDNGATPTVFVKTGPGQVTLEYGSTYTGGTIINSGLLGSNLGTTGAAGSVTTGPIGTGSLTVNRGGAYVMDLNGSTGTVNNTVLTLANSVVLNGGALWSADDYSHVTGSVTVNAAGGFLGSTYSGNTGAYSGTAATGFSKGLFVDGLVSGSGNLTLEQAGLGGNGALAQANENGNDNGNNFNASLVMFTNNSNTYSGTLTVNGSGSNNNTNYLGVNGNTALQFATVNVGATANGVGAANWGASPVLFETAGTANVTGDNFTFGVLTGSGNIALTEINEGNLAAGNSVALTVGNGTAGAANTTYSGVLSSGGSLTKSGTGTMALSGANTYTGTTTVSGGTLSVNSAGSTSARLVGTSGITVNTGGTLLLTNSTGTASTDRINNAATVTLNGGTLNANNLSEGAANGASGAVQGAASPTQGLGTLTVSGSSVIDFGSSTGISNTLAFANSNGTFGSGVLTIQNYEYNFATPAPVDHLFFGTDATGLTGAQLSQISFVNVNGVAGNNYGATMLTNGEVSLSPTPEPGSIVPILVGMAGLGVLIARRRKANAKNCQNELAAAV